MASREAERGPMLRHGASHRLLRYQTAPIFTNAEPLLPSEHEHHDTSRIPLRLSEAADRSPRLLALVGLLIYVFCGGIAFWATLGIGFVKAIYLAVVAGTTVGYGDFTPFLNGGMPRNVKLCIGIFYILLGNVVIGTSLSLLVSSVASKQGREFASMTKLLLLCAAMALLISCGSLGMSLLEGLPFLEGAYWAVVTISTVGFGDIVPTTDASRVFATVYILVGVALAGYIFTQVAALPLDAHQAKMEQAVRNQYGEELNEDALWELAGSDEMTSIGLSESDDYVTRDEFCLITLIRMGKVTVQELSDCQASFDKLDIRRNGRLDAEDLREWKAMKAAERRGFVLVPQLHAAPS
uniref:EF-hand domain-containing protein n=1 Tax=Chrysotila carterae TaxID=13221 RepID=A0A7S4B2B2_CHRCT